MAYGKLSPATFGAQNTMGRDLIPIDQAARAIIQERKAECRMEEKGMRPAGFPMSMTSSYENWRERHNIVEKVTKRLTTGGMTRRPEDSLVNPPRGKYPLTMRDL